MENYTCRHNNTHRIRLVRRSSYPIAALGMKQIECDVGKFVSSMVYAAMDWLDEIHGDGFWHCYADLINWHFALNDDAIE